MMFVGYYFLIAVVNSVGSVYSFKVKLVVLIAIGCLFGHWCLLYCVVLLIVWLDCVVDCCLLLACFNACYWVGFDVLFWWVWAVGWWFILWLLLCFSV